MASARPQPEIRYNIPEQPLQEALIDFSATSGVSVAFSKPIAAATMSPGATGRMQPADALDQLLDNTGYHARWLNPTTVTIHNGDASAEVSVHSTDTAMPGTYGPDLRRRLIEIVADGDRMPDTGFLIPVSVTVLSRGTIERADIVDLRKVVPRVPNMVLSPTRFGDAPNVIVRGIGNVFGVDPAIGYLVDGLSVSRGEILPVLHDVDQILVVRGPHDQSDGHGVVGTIRVTSAVPEPVTFLRARLTYARFDTVQLRSVINVPVSPTLFVRGAFFGRWGNSKTINVNPDNIGRGLNFTLARGSVRWLASDSITADLAVHYGREREKELALIRTGRGQTNTLFNAGIPPNPDNLTPFPENQTFSNHDFPVSRLLKSWIVRGKVTIDLGDVTFASTTGYVRQSGETLEDLDFTSVSFRAQALRFSLTSVTQIVSLNGGHNGNVPWTLGVRLSRDNASGNRAISSGPADPFEYLNFPNPNPVLELFDHVLFVTQYGRRQDSVVPYADVSVTPVSWLQISAGLKYQYERTRFRSPLFGFGGGPPIEASDSVFVSHDGLLPRGTIVATVSPWVKVHAAVAKGRKPGGVSSVIYDNAITFRPETIWTYEAGLQLDPWDGRVQMKLTGFYMDWNNIQTPIVETGMIRGSTIRFFSIVTGNTADGYSTGAELEFYAEPLPGLSLRGAVSYLESGYRAHLDFDPAAPDRPREDLPGAPRWSANADLEYQRELGKGLSSWIRLEWDYRTKMALEFRLEGFEEPLELLPGRHIVNLRIGLQRGRYEASLFVENLFNTRDGNGVSGLNSLSGILSEPNPRIVGVTLSAAL